MSSAPFRIAENWALVFISEEPGYTAAFSAPLLRFSMSAAKRRHRRSRKSPSLIVPPGNWCEIFSVPACAREAPASEASPAAPTVCSRSRRVMPMKSSPVSFWSTHSRDPRAFRISGIPRSVCGKLLDSCLDLSQGAGMQNAIAFCDNDVVVVAWSYGMKLAGCMGFAVYRIDAAGAETALPSMAVFPGFVAKLGQTTAAFPVQKFYWKDPYARLVADRTGTRSFRYKIVPVAGQPGKLKPMKVAFLVSNEIAISPVVASGVAAVFNRGLISTQRVSKALGGKPSKSALLAAIAKRDGALRKSLAGDMIPALLAFVARAKSGGALYAALYELGDDELIGALEGAGKRLHLILSNPSVADEQSASAITDGNAASRQRLAKTAGQLIDRMFSDGQIGHNKYIVYVDRHGTAKAVLFGSTNWTSTGLCAQTNNAMVCD